MDDRELDLILTCIARERHSPSKRVVALTKSRIRGRRLLQGLTLLSLATQLLAVVGIFYLFTSPDIEPDARIAGAVGLFAYLGCVVVVAFAARGHVSYFFRRLERLMA